MGQQQSDIDLIEAVLAGHTDAYTELVKRHQRFVFTLSMRFTKNREDAEEVAQDCFVKAYRALGTFQHSAKFSTWLYSITYTTAMSFLRRKRIETTSIDAGENTMQLENQSTDFSTVSIERKSGHAYLNTAIEMLPGDDAAIITLFYKGEQSLEEIGEALHMSSNTVKVRLHRARLRLKEKLQYLLKDEVKELL